MSYTTLAAALVSALDFEIAPVAIAFADAELAAKVSSTGASAPSACSFWRQGETRVFYAPAEAHYNCPIGAMVMGFDLPKEVSDELMSLVGNMAGCAYISEDEPSQIPVNKKKAQGIIYGPLSKFPVKPDVVLCWLNPFQAMIWSEAGGGATWGTTVPSTVFGRPACAALAASTDKDRPALSLGCMGMRAFTEISDNRLLGVVPESRLSDFVSRLQKLRDINNGMAGIYESRKAAFVSRQGAHG
jgi:uncharacterized protein (DUF169 family)